MEKQPALLPPKLSGTQWFLLVPSNQDIQLSSEQTTLKSIKPQGTATWQQSKIGYYTITPSPKSTSSTWLTFPRKVPQFTSMISTKLLDCNATEDTFSSRNKPKKDSNCMPGLFSWPLSLDYEIYNLKTLSRGHSGEHTFTFSSKQNSRVSHYCYFKRTISENMLRPPPNIK